MKQVNSFVFIAFVVVAASYGCGIKGPGAQEVLNHAIEKHGYEPNQELEVAFDFRGAHFKAEFSDGEEVYRRVYKLKEDTVEDFIKKDSFIRKVNNVEVDLVNDTISRKSSDDARSVIYFALLPYSANKDVISRQLMTPTQIKGNPYYKVEVTYNKNGGGRDFENVFVYWIHQQNYTIDYLAYSYYINGGGVRFREAYNQREVNGIIFQDYINYTIDSDFPAHELDYAFETGQLREVSKIDLKNVTVKK